MSDDPSFDMAASLVEFARRLSDEQSVESVFGALADHCTGLLGVDGTGVLLVNDSGLTVATANSEPGQIAERLEAELQEGPCTEAISTGVVVPAPDLAAVADRWPNFAVRATQAGIHGIYGVPIISGDHPIGALNVVTVRPVDLPPRLLSLAGMLAQVAVSYLVAIRATAQANELARQLQRALDSRIVIEQARGIVAGRHGHELPEAFELIRSHARRTRQRIHDVAAQICRGDLDLG